MEGEGRRSSPPHTGGGGKGDGGRSRSGSTKKARPKAGGNGSRRADSGEGFKLGGGSASLEGRRMAQDGDQDGGAAASIALRAAMAARKADLIGTGATGGGPSTLAGHGLGLGSSTGPYAAYLAARANLEQQHGESLELDNSRGRSCNTSAVRVYSKSPVKKGLVARSTGSGSALPGSVQNLLSKFGASSGGEVSVSNQGASAGGGTMNSGEIGDCARFGLNQETNSMGNVVNDENHMKGREAGSNLNDCAMKCDVVQEIVESHDTNMNEVQNSAHCTLDARQYASTSSGGVLASNQGAASAVSWDGLGKNDSRSTRPDCTNRWADEVDAEMGENDSAERGTQGVRQYAPTVADINFSLERVGFQPSLAGHLAHTSNNPGRGSTGAGNAMEGGGLNAEPGMPGTAGATHQDANVGSGGTSRAGGGTTSAWRKPSPVKVTIPLTKADVCSDGVAVDLDDRAVDRNMARLERALVGNLLGRRFPFTFLSGELNRRWGQFGGFKVVMTGPDCFICMFDSVEARDAVLMGGPWFIAGQVMGLDKWSEDLDPSSLQGRSAPVWIRFPRLPIQYWDNDNISRIAAAIGQPLWIDAQTSEGGIYNYARVCVRLDLARRLESKIIINGRRGRIVQQVEYEGLSFVCYNCGHVGHKVENCPVTRNMPPSMQNEEGTRIPTTVNHGGSHPSSSGNPPAAVGRNGGRSGEDASRGKAAVTEEAEAVADGLGPWIHVQRRKKPPPRKIGGTTGEGSLPKPRGGVVHKQTSGGFRPSSRFKPTREQLGLPPSRPSGVGGPSHAEMGSTMQLQTEQVQPETPLAAKENSVGMTDAEVDIHTVPSVPLVPTTQALTLAESQVVQVGTSPSQTAVEEEYGSRALVLHNVTLETNSGGLRERSVKMALSKELSRLGALPHLPKKRRKQSMDSTEGGDDSPFVDQ